MPSSHRIVVPALIAASIPAAVFGYETTLFSRHLANNRLEGIESSLDLRPLGFPLLGRFAVAAEDFAGREQDQPAASGLHLRENFAEGLFVLASVTPRRASLVPALNVTHCGWKQRTVSLSRAAICAAVSLDLPPQMIAGGGLPAAQSRLDQNLSVGVAVGNRIAEAYQAIGSGRRRCRRCGGDCQREQEDA